MTSSVISVIVPCFNRPNELSRALNSVSKQTIAPAEVIVCDDGSTEDLAAVVQEFTHKLAITYIRLANSGGPAVPRNVGVERARGDWIALLDSDDWWHPSKIEALTPALNGADIVYHRLRTVRARSGGRLHHRTHGWGTLAASSAALDLLTLGNPIPTSGAVVRRATYLALNGMQHDPPTIEDFDFWIRAALMGARFQFIPAVLGYYEDGAGSKSSAHGELIRYYQDIFERFESRFDGRERRQVVSYKHYCIAVQHLRGGDLAAARRHLQLASDLRTLRQRLSRSLKRAALALR